MSAAKKKKQTNPLDTILPLDGHDSSFKTMRSFIFKDLGNNF